MYAKKEKPKENKSPRVANSVVQKRGRRKATFQFVDNRPETIAQRKMQEIVNNSPHVQQQKAFQVMANNSLRIRHTAQYKAMADNYTAQQRFPVRKKVNKIALPDSNQAVTQRKINATTFKDFLKEQTVLQNDALKNPGNYAGKYITVGFEHEFAGMVDKLLHGTSHLQIAWSAEKMPYNKLPFFLETDAGNELELVDPPFLIETAEEGKPIPNTIDVDIAARLIERRLYDLIHIFPTLAAFIQKLRVDPGINFNVPRAQIEPKHLSHNTKSNFTASNNQIAPYDLLNIRLRPSEKHSSIATQINFATDIGNYFKIQNFNETPKESGYLGIGRDMADDITRKIKGATNEENIFIKLLNRLLAEQMAIPFMETVRNMQKKEFKGGHKIRDSKDRDLFIEGAKMSSILKDKNRVWIKDSLMSIGVGLFRGEKDWIEIYTKINSAKETASGMTISKDAGSNTKIYFAAAKENMLSVLSEILIQIDRKKITAKKIYEPDRKPGFLEHDPKLLGARQDTYVSPNDAQMPGIWDNKRLHVVETRGGGLRSLAMLQNNGGSDQLIKDDREQGLNYNIRSHGYFQQGKGFYDPILKVYKTFTGEVLSKNDEELDITTGMHFTPAIEMYYDPKIGMYYDSKENRYFDQGLQMYFYKNCYYTKDQKVKMMLNRKTQMYEDTNAGIYYDPAKRAWYNPKRESYKDVRTHEFTNLSKNLTYNPGESRGTEAKAEEDVPKASLRDVYPNFERITNKPKTLDADTLKKLGNIRIPYNTPPIKMMAVALKTRNKKIYEETGYYVFGSGFQEYSEEWIKETFESTKKYPSRLDELAGMLMKSYGNVDQEMKNIYLNYLISIKKILANHSDFDEESQEITRFTKKNVKVFVLF